MTSINLPAFEHYLKQRDAVKRQRIARKSLLDLRGVKSPAIGKKANLAEVYEQLIVDYKFYFEVCVKHDLEFQGKTFNTNANLEQNAEISLATNVDNHVEKIVVFWIHAQEMLSNSYMRENILKINKYRNFPKKELSEFLEVSKDHRIYLTSAFYDASLVSFAYVIKELNLGIETDSDVSKWKSILEHTYRKIIDKAIEGAKEVGVIGRKRDELWEVFEIDTLLTSGLKLFLFE